MHEKRATLLALLLSSPAFGADPAPAGNKPVCADCGEIAHIRQVQRPAAPERKPIPDITASPRTGGMGSSVQTVPLFSMSREGVSRVERPPLYVPNWEITVRFDNGAFGVVTQETEPDWKVGDRVKLIDNILEALPLPKR